MSNATVKRLLDLQALFDPFNRDGSTLRMAGGGHVPTDLGIMDSYTVTGLDGDNFWLLIKSVGYHAGPQYSHTVKVVAWTQPDGYLLDLVDDEDRIFNIEQIFPDVEEDLGETWRAWRRDKQSRPKFFKKVDAKVMEQHKYIMKTWDQ